MGPLPRAHVTSSADPDAVTTAAPAVPTQETKSGTTTHSAAERARVRLPEAEAEGAPPVQRAKTTSSAETTSQTTTTSSARALVERVGNEAGEDSQPPQIGRNAALMAECEESSTSDDTAEARRAHLEKLTKVKDAIINVVPHTDATTRPLTGRWVDTVHYNGPTKARWTTRGYEQTLNGNEDFFSATPAMMHLKMMLVDAALKGHVAAIGDCSGAFYQSPLNPDSLDRASSRGRIGTKLHLGSSVSSPRSQGSTESLGYIQRERPHELHAARTVTIRRLLVLSFRTKSRTSRGESKKTHRRLPGDGT